MSCASTPRSRNLLLYLETCVVDDNGRVDVRRVNTAEMALLKRWADVGFISFGRVTFATINTTAGAQKTHWVRLSDAAFTAAHAERRARADRLFAKRIWVATSEKDGPPLPTTLPVYRPARSTRKSA